MNTLKSPFYLLSIIAIVITLFMGYRNALTGLALFAMSPYVVTFFLVLIAKHNTALLTAQVVTVFIVFVGLYFLLDNTYMERHLGYKFSFLFMPLWQWTMLLFSGFVVHLSNTGKSK